jgi:hypothetical protein
VIWGVGGEFGPEMLTTATKKRATPLDFEEGFGKLKKGLRNAYGMLRVRLRNAK